MGIFYEQVDVYNRAPVTLTVRFDGQDITLQPGDNKLPRVAIPFAKNQNPIMGSADPYNPHMYGGRYLIVDKTDPEDHDQYEPLSADEWQEHLRRPCRDNEQVIFADRYGNDPKAKMLVRGKPGHVAAQTRSEAGEAPRGLASFDARD